LYLKEKGWDINEDIEYVDDFIENKIYKDFKDSESSKRTLRILKEIETRRI